MEFSTGAVKRVCRCTLAAEASGWAAALEAADYLCSAILAIIKPYVNLGDLLDLCDLVPIRACADANYFYDVVTKSSSWLQDKFL